MNKTSAIHPLLFAVYPVLFLYSRNIHEFPVHVVFLPILTAVGLVLLFWVLLNRMMKDRQKSAFVISFFTVLFFSYGHFYNVLENLLNRTISL